MSSSTPSIEMHMVTNVPFASVVGDPAQLPSEFAQCLLKVVNFSLAQKPVMHRTATNNCFFLFFLQSGIPHPFG